MLCGSDGLTFIMRNHLSESYTLSTYSLRCGCFIPQEVLLWQEHK